MLAKEREERGARETDDVLEGMLLSQVMIVVMANIKAKGVLPVHQVVVFVCLGLNSRCRVISL